MNRHCQVNSLIHSSIHPRISTTSLLFHKCSHLPECFLPLRLKRLVPTVRRAHSYLLLTRHQSSECLINKLSERYANRPAIFNIRLVLRVMKLG